jgi:surfeit locus 1 family protein
LRRALLFTLCLVAAIGFAALAEWQFERRIWKLDLIARVDARIHAAPVPIPPPGKWPGVNARDDEYRRVQLTGRFLHERVTLVDALTDEGPGVWVLTPLVTSSGTVLINRGFVPRERIHDYLRPQGVVLVTGLLRMSEPHGRILRPNRPDANLWYSRDVAAIAVARKLGRTAPFFIDAEATGRNSYPIGGLTVVRFRNAHLAYALTWLALAVLATLGGWRVCHDAQ